MRTVLIHAICLLCLSSYCQSDLRRVSVSSLPEDIQRIDNISMAVRWTDRLGDNVIVITKKIIKADDEDRVVYHGRGKGIIDLDNNKRSEIWLISRAECINDSQTGNMKIVMCEGNSRYTMNGSISSDISPEKKLDNNFLNGSQVFRKYAIQLWQQCVNMR